MPDMTAPIKLGANCWNQYTDWPSWLAAEQRADATRATTRCGPGITSIPSWAPGADPILEAYTAIAALAATTDARTIGLMVGANTFRNPALVAKMMTTIDHISGGRAVLGIGAAWFETEHTGFGIPFGDGPPERLRWLGQALPIMRGMLDGTEPTVDEGIYSHPRRAQRPAAGAAALPILIGGSGPGDPQAGRPLRGRLQPRRIARRPPEKEAALVAHCEAVGRDEREIERTVGIGVPVIRDSRAEAQRVQARSSRGNGERAGVGRSAGRHPRGRRRAAAHRSWSWATATSSWLPVTL